MRTDKVWQGKQLVDTFLTGVRGGIPFAQEQIHIALSILAQLDIPIEKVADLGCGDGPIAHAILLRYPEVKVTAIDFSKAMLNQAQQRLQDFVSRVTLVQADLFDANWQTGIGSFDAILSGYCIHHLPHERKQALYREIYQLLNPGGCFLNIEHVASPSPWLEEIFNQSMVDSLHQWQHSRGEGLSREEVACRYVYREDKQANILAPVEVQCDWLRAIGFQAVDCYFKYFELAVFGGIKHC